MSTVQNYLNPRTCPTQQPTREEMDPTTKTLHDAIDEQIRQNRYPYLHPEGQSVQLDLLNSAIIIAWQESKSQAVFLAEQCWSELPQIYGRYGTESTRELLQTIKTLENARAVCLTDSGMQACALLFDILVTEPCHVIIMRQIYNKSKKYLERLCEITRSMLSIVDDGDFHQLEQSLKSNTRLIFAETFTNPLMRALDPERIANLVNAARVKNPSLRLVIDNTIATPWATNQPLLNYSGIDFVVASGTKALSGNDRDMWGYVAANRIDPMNALMDLQAMRGGILDWRRAQAISTTFPAAKSQFLGRCEHASQIAKFLSSHPHIEEVFHPSLSGHRDNLIIKKYYQQPGSLLSFRIKAATDEETRHFCDVLASTEIIRYALSFDGLTTKVNHHRIVSEYFTPEPELKRAGIDNLVRLAVGVEHPDDIVACLNWALYHFRSMSPAKINAWVEQRQTNLHIDRK